MRPVAAEWFYAGGLTDRHDEAKSRFSKFCEKLQFCEKPPPPPPIPTRENFIGSGKIGWVIVIL